MIGIRLLKNAWIHYKYQKKELPVVVAFILMGISDKLNLCRVKVATWYQRVENRYFLKKFRVEKDGKSYFDFNGAKLPDVSAHVHKMEALKLVFYNDVFLIPIYYGDDYSVANVELLDRFSDGPYGYTDLSRNIDVTIKPDDVVFDAGAWLGDFSAYASSKGAVVYAFEPTAKAYDDLLCTVALNPRIIPVKKGLGDECCTLTLSEETEGQMGTSFVMERDKVGELAEITTIDEFVKENGLSRVDFIKADIEGFEREMLLGAKETLRLFAPKLSICTYHLPDDKEVLEHIILEANPRYTVIHMKSKLYAQVI